MQERREVVEVTCETSRVGRCVLTFDRTTTYFKSTNLIQDPWTDEIVITNNKDKSKRVRIFKSSALGTWRVQVTDRAVPGRVLRSYIVKYGAHSPEQGWEIVAKLLWE